MIYVEIRDADVIDQKYLPVNFNAKWRNPRRLEFERESNYSSAKGQLFEAGTLGGIK